MKNLFLFFSLLLFFYSSTAQHDERYVPETDPFVLEKLEQWQGLKFGLLMHWGPYSQWGVVESWSICSEDYGWCQRKKGTYPDNYTKYKAEYEGLKTTFNPEKFNPEKWAAAAKKAGMKYVVFTTKHHDGFCMFDSKYTDYKITDPECPFHSNSKSNIAFEIFNAFRNEGMWTGAYFSKPDWHCTDYWWPYFATPNRNVNYDPSEYPEKWENYVSFTHNQILELMTDYGSMDILWLDGGWVAKQSKEEIKEFYEKRIAKSETGFLKGTIVNQDIRMDELAEKVRKVQPGLIVVDRAVPGKNQNYLTPENRVPDKPLPYPWESCIIAGGGWSWVPNAKYMSGRKAVHLLVDIVAKGGNLLLNIAPGPDGTWHNGAYELLDEIGNWMKINNEAIYNTTAMPPYKEGNVCFTQNGETTYLIYLIEEDTEMPSEIILKEFNPVYKFEIVLLSSSEKIDYKKTDSELRIQVPRKVRKNPASNYACVFKISKK